LESALKANSFDVSIVIEIPFLEISVTIEPAHSLRAVRYNEMFDQTYQTMTENRLLRCYQREYQWGIIWPLTLGFS